MRKLIVAAALVCVVATPALAFGTINGLGQHEEHQRITRAAFADFAPRTLDELAGRRGRFGAIGAPDNPLRGLMFTDEAHCDNGDTFAAPGYPQSATQAQRHLERCRAWMVQWLDRAVRDAAPLVQPDALNTKLDCAFVGQAQSAKCAVLADMGIALHAAQDFYAHTNWVDRPANAPLGPLNPPGLGQTGRAPWLDPRQSSQFPVGLISGCFGGMPENWYCKYDDTVRVRHAALNKDEGDIGADGVALGGTTPRGAINGNFVRAVAAAEEDSRDKWAYVQQRVLAEYGPQNGQRVICVLKTDDFTRCG